MSSSVLVMGLPRSGKTTFLAALWHVVTAKGEIDSKLTLDELRGDYAHLNSLRDTWLQRKEFERTKLGDQKKVTMKLAVRDRRLQLTFPDYSGEIFRRQWRDRICERDLADQIAGSDNVMFFVHADKFLRPWLLPNIIAVQADQAAPEDTENNEPGTVVRWDARNAATQVQVVDLLQLMMRPPLGPKRRRLALMLSAWDKVTENHLWPARWLADAMPLLAQFLNSNHDSFDTSIYGISAQGGDYQKDDKALAKIVLASHRIRLVHEGTNSHDITSPICWTLGER